MTVPHKTILVMICATSVALSVFGYVNYHASAADLNGSIHEKLGHCIARLVEISRPALWNMEQERLEPVLEAEMSDAELEVIVVREIHKGKLRIAKAMSRNEERKAIFAKDEPALPGISKTAEILQDGKKIGEVTIGLNSLSINAKLQGLMWSTIGQNVALNIVIVLVLVLALRQLFVKPLKVIISVLGDKYVILEESSVELVNSSNQLASNATTQSDCVADAVQSVEALNGQVDSNVDAVSKARVIVTDTAAVARKNAENAKLLIGAMGEIQSSSSKVSEILGVIDGIAQQTNLLALNASVEAARAGDAGRGFAVVAEEVRRLALSSAEAAKEISRKVKEVHQSSVSGTEIALSTVSQFEDIANRVFTIEHVVEEINEASRAQIGELKGVSENTQHIAEIAKETEDKAQGTLEIADLIGEQLRELERGVAVLTNMVGR